MKLYHTKNRLIYEEPSIIEKLSQQFDDHEAIYGEPPTVIYMEAKHLKEYIDLLDKYFPITPMNMEIKYRGCSIVIINEWDK